ncbi:GntR family transcriptional regulator [Cellulomonas soli]|uniref:GntR family transcriptional regulator n=1 Tax=Cellulomonas soli TaxID=931535 RepID=A0A512PCK2_9CELL|nr:GntR family transcriptional regulator [Cellulomonas soli]NYI58431.1 GntR family transcriptional regulator [Cellulomonas soli]GEP68852.1 GntR family transcriptional regulator [Cellulomonas soli]
MRITLDLDSGVPHYEQLRAQIATHIASGRLRPGDPLPTVRTLAADLGIAAGTIARTYRELEAAGLVSTRRRHGTVVTAADHGTTDRVTPLLRELVDAAREQGIADPDLIDLLRGTLALAGAGPST